MVLIVVEKKENALAISAALPHPELASKPKGGCIDQGEYKITWLGGHILKLKEPEDYDACFKNWSIDQLPINFPNWGLKPAWDENGVKEKRLNDVGIWLRSADSVIHAGDPDQEGQLLVDEVLRWHNYQGPVKRLNTSDTTVAGLQKALANMTNNNLHLNAGWSAYARSVADFLVGINMSRLFTCINETKLSVGRVQTPTLGLVVARDLLIEGHQKSKYYTINATIVTDAGQEITVRYVPDKESPDLVEGKILDKNIAAQKVKMLQHLRLENIEIKKKIVFENPPLPFNMVKLQTYCNKTYNMSLQDVMATSQSLRDNHQAITYNRTDCQYLTDNHYDEAPATMATVIQNINYRPKALDMTLRSDAFNPEQVKNHHGIIPTNNAFLLGKLTPKEKNVYLAIAKYYMAQFMPPAKKEVTTLTAKLPDGGTLTATSTIILDPGYRAIFREAEKDEESVLSAIAAGICSGTVTGPVSSEKETKPPARYTQASLAEDMTCISKYCTDERIKRILREKDKDSKEDNGSIGTVATRTPIILGLIEKGFLEDDGKHIKSTKIGRELYRILPAEVKGVDMTAEWWLVCESIVDGKTSPAALQRSVLEVMMDIIARRDSYPKVDPIIAATNQRIFGQIPVGICPRCKEPVIEGKVGYGCTGWKKGCKFVLWKNPKGAVFKDITITKAKAKKLLAGEKVKFENLYSSNNKNSFTGYLVMNDTERSEYGAKLNISFDAPSAGGRGSQGRGTASRGAATTRSKTR